MRRGDLQLKMLEKLDKQAAIVAASASASKSPTQRALQAARAFANNSKQALDEQLNTSKSKENF